MLRAATSALALAGAAAVAPPCAQYDPKLETPCNIVVANQTNYVVRQYNPLGQQAFTFANVTGANYNSAVGTGFRANFEYIEGSNSVGVKIPMTAPVLTFGNGSDWHVGFYCPASLYPTVASIPVPSDSDVIITPLPDSVYYAVVEFPGFAGLNDYQTYQASLLKWLAADGVSVVPADSPAAYAGTNFAYAGYDSPFTIFNRHNEVWIQVEWPTAGKA